MTERRPPAPPASLREENRAFWEGRGGAPGGGYAATMISEHARFTGHVHRTELAYLRRWLPACARVLDLGCGEGRLALALAGDAREIVGVDISSTLVGRARAEAERRGIANVRFEQRSLDAPFAAGAYDVVLLSGVLNCLDDAGVGAALASAAAALPPGGLVYLRNNCANRRAFFRPADGQHAPTWHRTAADYRARVAAAGLVVLEERFLFPPLLWPNLVFYHLLPRRISALRPMARLLDAWFAFEERTSEARLRRLGPLYDWLVRAVRKPTSFRVVVARRP